MNPDSTEIYINLYFLPLFDTSKISSEVHSICLTSNGYIHAQFQKSTLYFPLSCTSKSVAKVHLMLVASIGYVKDQMQILGMPKIVCRSPLYTCYLCLVHQWSDTEVQSILVTSIWYVQDRMQKLIGYFRYRMQKPTLYLIPLLGTSKIRWRSPLLSEII